MSAITFRGRPRGTQSVSDRQREAYRLNRDQGVPVRVLCSRFGVAEGTVRKWIGDVEQAIADERHLQGRR